MADGQLVEVVRRVALSAMFVVVSVVVSGCSLLGADEAVAIEDVTTVVEAAGFVEMGRRDDVNAGSLFICYERDGVGHGLFAQTGGRSVLPAGANDEDVSAGTRVLLWDLEALSVSYNAQGADDPMRPVLEDVLGAPTEEGGSIVSNDPARLRPCS